MATSEEINAFFESSKQNIKQTIAQTMPEALKDEHFKMSFQLSHPSGAQLHFGLCACYNAQHHFGLHDCRDCVPPQ